VSLLSLKGKSMPSFGQWIKRTVQQVIDPDREARVGEVTKRLHHDLQKQRDSFSMQAFADRLDCTYQDIDDAKRKVYEILLDKAWRDGKVAADEHRVLSWAVKRLELPAGEAANIQLRAAKDRFAAALAKAMDDGVIDDEEANRLSDIAQSVGCAVGEFVNRYFQSEGETFLRGVFTACTESGMLADSAWAQLLKSTERLGVSRQGLRKAIQHQAERFIEHVIADAKSDGELSEEEEAQIKSLTQTLGMSAASRGYFDSSLAGLRVIRLARQGRLPTLAHPPGIGIRSGEIVHFHKPATWHQLRVLKSGDSWEGHSGTITITDNRLLFSSSTKSFDVRFAKIARHSGTTGRLRLQRMEKAESVVDIIEDEPIAYAILEGAIALANQTRLAPTEGMPTRHIPRDVRQRVWQRYGGQCAECGDAQYLEFDHIIPVAKGGSNSDANVQLLCRNCNLKKSAFI
jgi:tellurite resistance protein